MKSYEKDPAMNRFSRTINNIVLVAGTISVLTGASIAASPAAASPTGTPTPSTQVTKLVFQPNSSTPFSDSICGVTPAGRTNDGCRTAGNLASYSQVSFIDLDGSNLTTMRVDCTSGSATNWQAPWEGVDRIAVDQSRNRILWEMSSEPGISSVDSDGTDCGLIANGGYYGAKRIAIESGANFIYSTQYTNLRRFPAIAGSAPTGENGTNLTLTGLAPFTFTGVNDMAAAGGKLYMAVYSNTSKAIIEVTLDETTTSQQARVLIQGETAVNNVQVDSVNNRIYWGTGSAVRRAVLSDGSGITTVATGQYSWAVPVPAESKIVAGGSVNPTVMDMSGNIIGTLNINTKSIPVPISFTLTGQTVTWSPNTNLDLSDSPATPSALAASSGPGAIQYSVLNAGTTGCTVIPSTGVLTFTTVGTCVVRATTAASGNYASGNTDVLFVITDRNATTTTAAAAAVTTTTTTAAAVTTTTQGSTTTTVTQPLLPATGQDTSSGSLVAFFLVVTGLAMLVLGVRRRSAVN